MFIISISKTREITTISNIKYIYDVDRFKPSKNGTVSNFAEYWLGLKFFLKGSTFKLIY